MYNCLTSDLDLLLPIAYRYYRIIDVKIDTCFAFFFFFFLLLSFTTKIKTVIVIIIYMTDSENPFAIYRRLSFSYENSIFNAKLIRLTEYIVERIAHRR